MLFDYKKQGMQAGKLCSLLRGAYGETSAYAIGISQYSHKDNGFHCHSVYCDNENEMLEVISNIQQFSLISGYAESVIIENVESVYKYTFYDEKQMVMKVTLKQV